MILGQIAKRDLHMTAVALMATAGIPDAAVPLFVDSLIT